MTERGFVISDVHLGAGSADPELEDFDADDLFSSWVKSIAKADTTLVLNGDIVDFAQIPPYDVPDDSRLLWTEQASLRKLKVAEDAHPRCFDALAEFVACGGRLRINIGNHDLDMAWPRVQSRLRERLRAPTNDQVSFSVRATSYHGVVIEHGHQFTPENCPTHPESFIHEVNGTEYLERVWGTDFMLQFYNDLEREFSYADNVKPMLTVLWYGIKKGWVAGRHFLRLVLFLKRRGLPWSGMASAVLDEGEELSIGSAIHMVENERWVALLRDRLEADTRLEEEFQSELDALSVDARRVLRGPGLVALEDGALESEAALLGLFREDREIRAAREHLKANGVSHVVFGHTHRKVDGALDGALFNPGTWIPHLRLDDPSVRAKIEEHGVTQELLRDPRQYTAERYAVLIEPDPVNRSHVRLEKVG